MWIEQSTEEFLEKQIPQTPQLQWAERFLESINPSLAEVDHLLYCAGDQLHKPLTAVIIALKPKCVLKSASDQSPICVKVRRDGRVSDPYFSGHSTDAIPEYILNHIKPVLDALASVGKELNLRAEVGHKLGTPFRYTCPFVHSPFLEHVMGTALRGRQTLQVTEAYNDHALGQPMVRMLVSPKGKTADAFNAFLRFFPDHVRCDNVSKEGAGASNYSEFEQTVRRVFLNALPVAHALTTHAVPAWCQRVCFDDLSHTGPFILQLAKGGATISKIGINRSYRDVAMQWGITARMPTSASTKTAADVFFVIGLNMYGPDQAIISIQNAANNATPLDEPTLRKVLGPYFPKRGLTPELQW